MDDEEARRIAEEEEEARKRADEEERLAAAVEARLAAANGYKQEEQATNTETASVQIPKEDVVVEETPVAEESGAATLEDMLKAFGSSKTVTETSNYSDTYTQQVKEETVISQPVNNDIGSNNFEDKSSSTSVGNSSGLTGSLSSEKPLTLEEQLKNFKASRSSNDEIEYAGASEYRTLEDQIRFYEQNVSSTTSIFGKKKRK